MTEPIGLCLHCGSIARLTETHGWECDNAFCDVVNEAQIAYTKHLAVKQGKLP